MNWLEEFSPKEQKLWQEIMLSHSFGTEEWGAAREMLKLILENDFRQASEDSIRSYISCCADSLGSINPLPDLKDVVSEFYEQYGMDNSIPIKC